MGCDAVRRKKILALILCLAALGSLSLTAALARPEEDDFIKSVDFNVPMAAMKKAVALDIASRDEDEPLDFIELLALLSAENGNNFSGYRDRQLDELARKLREGKAAKSLTKEPELYDYYLEVYEAVLGGFVGEYEIQYPDSGGCKRWVREYGLKVFSPIAKGFGYAHYDDFGASRSYGYVRPHLGNDLLGQVGTPIIAVEGGVIEALGWNRYGGWRIGLRSFDGLRYYYYAHLRKGSPYAAGLAEGLEVKAGDVIGYMGRTGYSTTEDVNNIKSPHLHFGMQLIFDESQKDSENEIWIDVYQIVRLLDSRRSETVRDAETKQWRRVYDMR
jgi:murein DD-endopeptidase MepM/ murein hydrolase activator NlpD